LRRERAPLLVVYALAQEANGTRAGAALLNPVKGHNAAPAQANCPWAPPSDPEEPPRVPRAGNCVVGVQQGFWLRGVQP